MRKIIGEITHLEFSGPCTPTNTLIIFGLILSATALGFFFTSLRESEYFLLYSPKFIISKCIIFRKIRLFISNYAIPSAILIPAFVVYFAIQKNHGKQQSSIYCESHNYRIRKNASKYHKLDNKRTFGNQLDVTVKVGTR